jgi:hypothetical protein
MDNIEQRKYVLLNEIDRLKARVILADSWRDRDELYYSLSPLEEALKHFSRPQDFED